MGKKKGDTAAISRPGRLTDRVVELCSGACTGASTTERRSVSALLAEDPELTPSDAWERLFGGWKGKGRRRKWKGMVGSKGEGDDADGDGGNDEGDLGVDGRSIDGNRSDEDSGKEVGDDGEERSGGAQGSEIVLSTEDLLRAAKCGKWGPTRPSDLFLKIYHDALCTLDADPLLGMVSPSLMGSYGVVPLTIISVIPDIARHMSNAIVRAQREVFLATNYWQDSVASKFLTDAIRELNRRAGQRSTRVVVKIIYDRGSPKQLLEPHYYVPEKEYTGKNVNLPSPEEIPNIDMQVINFHTPLIGTFHAKYMVVDRRVAILQSNNVQDNDNLEMMVHLEGPIVDSFYDMALISWHKKLDPPMPCRDSPAAAAWDGVAYREEEGVIGDMDVESKIVNIGNIRSDAPNGAVDLETERYLNKGDQDTNPQDKVSDSPLPEHNNEIPHYDATIQDEIARSRAALAPKPHETHMQAVTRLLNHTTNKGLLGDPAAAEECPPDEQMTPYIASQQGISGPFPMALVNRSPYGPPNHRSVANPQNAAWLAGLRYAEKSVFIQTPTLNAEPLVPAIREACERGVDVFCFICLGYNDAGELLPNQGGHNEMIAHSLYHSLSPAARPRLHYAWYVAKDQTKPLVQSRRERSCHIKLMIVDERVGIQGNGNQDTQSWYHSQEINVMIDSEEVCKAWVDGLRRNQNTHVYGNLGEDGVWRDEEGNEAEGVVGVDPGKFSWVKGMVGAVKRVRGVGGF